MNAALQGKLRNVSYEIGLGIEYDGEVVDLCHDFAGITHRHDGGIAAVVQSILDSPMGVADVQDAFGSLLVATRNCTGKNLIFTFCQWALRKP
jgi:hypothetical protein